MNKTNNAEKVYVGLPGSVLSWTMLLQHCWQSRCPLRIRRLSARNLLVAHPVEQALNEALTGRILVWGQSNVAQTQANQFNNSVNNSVNNSDNANMSIVARAGTTAPRRRNLRLCLDAVTGHIVDDEGWTLTAHDRAQIRAIVQEVRKGCPPLLLAGSADKIVMVCEACPAGVDEWSEHVLLRVIQSSGGYTYLPMSETCEITVKSELGLLLLADLAEWLRAWGYGQPP